MNAESGVRNLEPPRKHSELYDDEHWPYPPDPPFSLGRQLRQRQRGDSASDSADKQNHEHDHDDRN